MPIGSEKTGGTLGAIDPPLSTFIYSDVDWRRISETLPEGSPPDARRALERAVRNYLDAPSNAELRAIFGEYAAQMSLVKNAIDALTAAVRGCVIKEFDDLSSALRSASELAESKRIEFLAEKPGAAEKAREPWPAFLNTVCGRWHAWHGERPVFARSLDGVAYGPAIDFLIAVAASVRGLRAPANRKPMTAESAAHAIRRYRSEPIARI